MLAGLAARREAGLPPAVIVPATTSPATPTWRVVRDLAEAVGDPGLTAAVEDALFATTMVDRITPAATSEDLDWASSANGFADGAPVVTEPFSEWVLSGRFPAGRPRWEDAGARFVPDVRPFELRKLWLLNGAHSLLAYTPPAARTRHRRRGRGRPALPPVAGAVVAGGLAPAADAAGRAHRLSERAA